MVFSADVAPDDLIFDEEVKIEPVVANVDAFLVMMMPVRYLSMKMDPVSSSLSLPVRFRFSLRWNSTRQFMKTILRL